VTPSGRRIVFPGIAPCDPRKPREFPNKGVTGLFEALAVAFVSDPYSSNEVIRHVVEAAGAALGMPEFVEALKQRGAVVLEKGETMEEREVAK
jgi:hypothetical protein